MAGTEVRKVSRMLQGLHSGGCKPLQAGSHFFLDVYKVLDHLQMW